MLAVGAVLIGSFVTNFHSRTFSVGLPDLRGALSLSFDEGAWLNTFTMAPQIFIAPAVAWLATTFGIRRVLIGPGLLYALISLLIPFSNNYHTLLALSISHALLLGTFVPATIMIIFNNLPAKWWLPAIGIYCIRVGYAQNFGQEIVGYYTSHLSWRWLYWQDIAPVLLMSWLVHLGTPRQPINKTLLAKADWGGMMLFGTGLAMVYAGLDQGNRLDWLGSGVVTSLLTGGGVLLVGFFLNEMLVHEPWAKPDMLFSRNVGLSLVLLFLFVLTNLSNSYLVPSFLTSIAKLRTEQIGPVILKYLVVPMLLLLPLATYLLKRMDSRLVLIIGLAAFSASGLLGTRLTHDWAPDDFIPILILQAIGQAFTLFTLIIMVLSNSNPARATAFSAYIQVMRLGVSETGTALIATWIRIHEQHASNLIGKHVVSGGFTVTNALNRLSEQLATLGAVNASEQALAVLTRLVQREASVLAYINGFWLTFSAGILALLLLAFVGAAPPGPFTPPQKPRLSA
jgi:DHA2 family multidrug resistance protein